jgi:hypothetical protein
MPSALREHQHEISRTSGTEGLVFGTEDTGYLTLLRPAHTSGEVRATDGERPQEDGIMFGRDYRGAKMVTFEIGVLTDKINGLGALDAHRSNLDYLNTLEAFWLDETWRNSPRAMAMLRSHEAGQTWRCYGRPRRYDETVGKLTESGYTPIVCDFQLIDDRWYADVESLVDVPLIAPPEGGLVAPLVAPLTTTLSTSGQAVAVVGGTRTTWPVVEFHGPVTNPELTIGDLTIGLTMSLAYDHTITVDTRPWSRSVTRNTDGAGFAGNLSRRTPVMRKALLATGAHEMTYRGTDATGTSWARLRWRDARARP